MFVLKGFITNALFANNTPGVVATFGEISTQSLTYAREKGLYKSPVSNDITLVSFTNKLNDVVAPVTNDLADHIADVAKYICDKIVAGTAGFTDTLLIDLLDHYTGKAVNFQCGAIATDGVHSGPEWISWKNTSINGFGDNSLKIWFSDPAFQSQYDDFQIVVIPPTTAIDDFFKTGSLVEQMLHNYSPSVVMNLIQQAKEGYPETFIRAETYDYIDPFNAAHIVPATFNLLIYGAAGNNIDSITDALTSYVLAHSTHARPDWVKILPDLFRRTEFVIAPIWNQYGIPNRTLQAGIYSPVVNLVAAANLIPSFAPSYPAPHVTTYTSVVSHPYKSLQVLAVGSPDNRNAWFSLTDVFPDYINSASTSADFNRMSQATQDWSAYLMNVILAAEEMTASSSVPFGMTRLIRNGILYAVFRFKNINYLVAAKSNFPLPVVPAPTPTPGG